MTPGFTLHTQNSQPRETFWKNVVVRLFDSDRFVTFNADLMNWKIEGKGAPSDHGRIIEYRVIN